MTDQRIAAFAARTIAEARRDPMRVVEAWDRELEKPLPTAEVRAELLRLGAERLARESGGVDAADLLALDLAPLAWIVPEVLPEGTTIVAAPPKVGKSCLVYQVAVEVAIGGELLGRRVTPGAALYLALEDGQRRGRDRLTSALAGRTMPRGRLEIRWSSRRISEGLEADIEAWLNAHPDARLVAIDTLQRVRPATNGKRGQYELDVADLARLQDLFRDRPGIALLIVHHSRKEAGDDFLASVSGTYGITGSADTILVLKRKRLEAFGTCIVTGRDVPEAEIPVRFDGMTWHEAPASLPAASFERTEIYRIIETTGPIFPKAIGDLLDLERTSVQHMVDKLVSSGAVARTTGGYIATKVPYVPDHSDTSGSDWSVRGHVGRSNHPRQNDNDYPASALDGAS
jgi:AAA domain